LNKIIP